MIGQTGNEPPGGQRGYPRSQLLQSPSISPHGEWGRSFDASSYPVTQNVPIRHRRTPLTALTPLRFFAAVDVVLFHFGLPGKLGSSMPVSRFLASGFNGVTLFFVLSGFILVYNYTSVPDPAQFWVARFARVYPAYLLAIFLVVLLTMAVPPYAGFGLPVLPALLSLLLLQAWWAPMAFVINSPAWTLSVEAFFYAVFPWLTGPVLRLRMWPFGLSVFCWSALCFLPKLLSTHVQTDAGVQLASFLEGPFPPVRLPAFLIGMFAGAVYLRRQADPHGSNRERRWSLVAGLAGSLGLLCLAPPLLLRPVRTAALSLSFALLVYGMAGVRSRFLASTWMQTAGEISYGVYILQMPVLRVCLGLQRRLLPHAREQGALYLPVLIVFALLVFEYVEKPARLFLRSRLQRSDAQTS